MKKEINGKQPIKGSLGSERTQSAMLFNSVMILTMIAAAAATNEKCCIYADPLDDITPDKALTMGNPPSAASCVKPYTLSATTCATSCATLKCTATYDGKTASVHVGTCGQSVSVTDAKDFITKKGAKDVSCGYMATAPGAPAAASANSTSKSSASSIIPTMASTVMGFLVVPSLMMSLVQ